VGEVQEEEFLTIDPLHTVQAISGLPFLLRAVRLAKLRGNRIQKFVRTLFLAIEATIRSYLVFTLLKSMGSE